MQELRNILNDLGKRKYLESYAVIIVGLVALILDLTGNVEQSITSKIILSILITLVYIAILERRDYSKLLEERDVEGIAAFRINRDRIAPLIDHLKKAEKEIAMLAVQHSTLVHECLGLLEEKAKTGCKIKILMMSPKAKDGSVNPNVHERESQSNHTRLLPLIVNSTDTFRSWLGSLKDPVRSRIEIRTYRTYPVASYLIVDKDKTDGYVQVEVLLSGCHVRDLPHYIVTKRQSESFFRMHVDSFEKLWEKSQVLTPTKDRAGGQVRKVRMQAK